MTRTKTYATREQARAALIEWQKLHREGQYSPSPFESTLRSYLHSLEPGEEMDEIEAAWDWALEGFIAPPASLRFFAV